MSTDEPSGLVSPKWIAQRGNVANDCIYRLIRTGKLPAIRIGKQLRIPREVAEALLRGEL